MQEGGLKKKLIQSLVIKNEFSFPAAVMIIDVFICVNVGCIPYCFEQFL